jgi:threonine aldolase
MVFFSWPPAEDAKTAARVVENFKKHKIIIKDPENGLFRFTTHYWIGEAEVEAILSASREIFGVMQKR